MADKVSRELMGQHNVPGPEVRLTPFACDVVSATEWIEKKNALKLFTFVTENPHVFYLRAKGVRPSADAARVVSDN